MFIGLDAGSAEGDFTALTFIEVTGGNMRVRRVAVMDTASRIIEGEATVITTVALLPKTS